MAFEGKKESTEALTKADVKALLQQVAWDVVPQLAEALLREELDKQLKD